MKNSIQTRQKILIVDDSEMNRSILNDMLEKEFEILEAENGVQAVELLEELSSQLALVLLDIVMPKMDGFGVLAVMNKHRWIEEVPVIMMSAEDTPSYIERAYALGVMDYISRPFDALIVHRRVINTIMLYAKQKKLLEMVADQIYEKEKSNRLMIAILSHIVEFRNGESGRHVLAIHAITELLLEHLIQKTDQYQLTASDIALICTASALHDIGKIAIPEEILNKPGKLTKQEFETVKTHCMIGASMLEALILEQDEPLIKTAYEICRWHHERYDGKGYPDGLEGDAIPISAQMVALADVYDALTSERAYKRAIPHQKAIQMIVNGECGCFNPLLLECLMEIENRIQTEMEENMPVHNMKKGIREMADPICGLKDLTASDHTLRLLEYERIKHQFFASMSQEIQFEFTKEPARVIISDWGARRLGLNEIIANPLIDEQLCAIIEEKDLGKLTDEIHKTTPQQPVTQYDCQLLIGGQRRWNRIICRANWSLEGQPRFLGVIGKVMDIHEQHTQLIDLRHRANHDALTGLFNHTYAKEQIRAMMSRRPKDNFVLVLFDLDHFKTANDCYGHIFGDHVLQFVAERLRKSIRNDDIAARVGGDEFLVFLNYQTGIEAAIERIFHMLTKEYGGYSISVSMGIVKTQKVGNDYDTLFHYADQALYAAKEKGRGRYCFFDDNRTRLSHIPLEAIEKEYSSAAAYMDASIHSRRRIKKQGDAKKTLRGIRRKL